MDLSSYTVTGANNPGKQVSVTKWNALLTDIAAGSASPFSLRADVAGIATPTDKQKIIFDGDIWEFYTAARYLSETGRSLTAAVAAHPTNVPGVLIAPSSDTTGASGAWVRKFSGPRDIRWFGAVADCTGYGVGTDNSPAILAAITSLLGSGGSIYIPDGKFRCSSQLVVKSAIRLRGTTVLQDSTSVSNPDAQRGSTLVFDSGVAGIKFFYTVDGDVSGTAVNPGASGSVMEGIRLISASAGAVSAGKYGVESRARITLRDCEVRGFGDHGVYVRASLSGGDGVVYGNANGSLIENVKSISNGGDGFKTSGNDCNVGLVSRCHAQNNTGWGFTDDSLIQTTWHTCIDEGNTAGGYQTLRASVTSSFLGCETENSTSTRFSIGAFCQVLGGNLEQVTSLPPRQNYAGMWIKSGKVLALYNAGNSLSLTLSNDGTNILTNGPLKVQGNIQCRSGSLGYVTGNGGSVTQATSKSTGVTLNKPSGQITMTADPLAANTAVSFTLTNSAIAAGDQLVLNDVTGVSAGSYMMQARCFAGGAIITVRNLTGGSLSDAVVIGFSLMKGATA